MDKDCELEIRIKPKLHWRLPAETVQEEALRQQAQIRMEAAASELEDAVRLLVAILAQKNAGL